MEEVAGVMEGPQGQQMDEISRYKVVQAHQVVLKVLG